MCETGLTETGRPEKMPVKIRTGGAKRKPVREYPFVQRRFGAVFCIVFLLHRRKIDSKFLKRGLTNFKNDI